MKSGSMFLLIISFFFLGSCTYPSSRKNQYTSQHLSKEEFKNMIRTGLPEGTVEKILRKNQVGFSFTTDEILELRKQNISNRLIWIAMNPREKASSPPISYLTPDTLPPPRKQKKIIQRPASKKTITAKKYPSLFHYGDRTNTDEDEEFLPLKRESSQKLKEKRSDK